MNKQHKVYTFKKGQHVHLDTIYDIQGLGSSIWWEKSGMDVDSSKQMEIDLGDDLVITRDITITVTIEM